MSWRICVADGTTGSASGRAAHHPSSVTPIIIVVFRWTGRGLVVVALVRVAVGPRPVVGVAPVAVVAAVALLLLVPVVATVVVGLTRVVVVISRTLRPTSVVGTVHVLDTLSRTIHIFLGGPVGISKLLRPIRLRRVEIIFGVVDISLGLA